jgi:hypothetical protein
VPNYAAWSDADVRENIYRQRTCACGKALLGELPAYLSLTNTEKKSAYRAAVAQCVVDCEGH